MSTSSRRNTPGPAVAVLGAGIMGSSVALFLARRGIKVVLFDSAASAFTAASRWNEGKIHLGYLYAADQSLATVRKLLPGGLSFPRLVSELVGRDIRDTVTANNDVYLVHRHSVVSAQESFAHAKLITSLIREHPDADQYFTRLSTARPRRLSQSELDENYNTDDLVFGYEVPERSVSTLRIADYFTEAISGDPQIETMWNSHVCHVRRNENKSSSWSVETQSPEGKNEYSGPFQAVVNALWEDRGRIDAPLGVQHSDTWTHRYRVSVFASTRIPVSMRSAVITVGPFGDMKNYDGRHLYFSWYKAGLLAEGTELVPPPVPELNTCEREKIADETLKQLGLLLPGIQSVRDKLESVKVRGGWVYAAGTGSLRDRQSDLHRRDNVGVVFQDGYFSVDTGKYSIAPWLAQQVAEAVCSI